ncbi:hypothetical protein QE197_09350 [Arsenophonus nasoniae]|uniref:Uncharacterized protein n=1 Tax=Arsenophonus nasoniae TaxID=638 RepID=A0A4P7KUE4_9GAMM|nr:hypothetical protein [Arsenophonus nasoniae]QBY42822.1 hypothetical protein ArsFIN_13820 [Arsenophonus nasoniae]QBY43456.1 hypothetical protein ArsFIN_20230 [Arsenophonus nasoniae]QBY43645.1 hypothetical protein ArsFIN_22130 [Arsenophonus nasoniae]QBY44191.1 hypothetical protein ArsFIN_27680 [Arsenophonus nasoniae]WGM04488.1 hypothetical protein QE258_12725 [Arsenophonus nasoniae]
MKPVIKVNGAELGIFTSVTYVLERLIDFSREGTPDQNVQGFKNLRYSVNHPNILNSYLVFHRNARREGENSTYTEAIKQGNVFAIRAHNTTNVYIYRPQLPNDSNDKGFLKIHNEKKELFYSSSHLPLKIDDIVFGPFPKPGYFGQMTLVYITAVYEPDNQALAFVNGYSVSKDGIIAITEWTGPSFGCKGWGYNNNFGAVMAYAPDAYPRWK